ncbi:monooxygenase [Basidiobolus ranarum]|uniref:Monooxygenase n=1 Tax=Basidiobolus ranarum TaxID=34480 RepID=A0ABR2W6A6_9FUNG
MAATDSEHYSFQKPVKRIAIVGAGPTGLIVGKNLSQEDAFEVNIFERNDSIGGIWNYSVDKGPAIQYPQLSAGSYDTHCGPIPSPMYQSLRTNLFHDVMEVHGHKFPDHTDTYPQHGDVLRYLQTYAKKFDLMRLISFNTTVISAKWDSEEAQWSVELATKQDNQIETRIEIFDAFIVCNGHHSVPHVPEIPGLQESVAQYPQLFKHSSEYRDAEEFREQSVFLIGSQASGVDIAHDLAKYPDIQVNLAIRNMPGRPVRDYKSFNPKITRHPEITSFDSKTREIHFIDGTSVPFPDHIIFSTGYFYSYPFFRNNTHEALNEVDVTDGFHVKSLYKHLFYAPNPTLCFVALQNIASPFVMADYQGKVMAKVFSGKAILPNESDMLTSYLKDIEGKPGPIYHIAGLGQIDYLDELSNWVDNAIPVPTEQWRQRLIEINDIVLERLGFKTPLAFN